MESEKKLKLTNSILKNVKCVNQLARAFDASQGVPSCRVKSLTSLMDAVGNEKDVNARRDDLKKTIEEHKMALSELTISQIAELNFLEALNSFVHLLDCPDFVNGSAQNNTNNVPIDNRVEKHDNPKINAVVDKKRPNDQDEKDEPAPKVARVASGVRKSDGKKEPKYRCIYRGCGQYFWKLCGLAKHSNECTLRDSQALIYRCSVCAKPSVTYSTASTHKNDCGKAAVIKYEIVQREVLVRCPITKWLTPTGGPPDFTHSPIVKCTLHPCTFFTHNPFEIHNHLRIDHFGAAAMYKCDWCGKVNLSGRGAWNHAHSLCQGAGYKLIITYEKNTAPFEKVKNILQSCAFTDCDFTTPKPLLMVYHYRSKHRGNKITYRCDKCDCIKGDPYAMLNHLRTTANCSDSNIIFAIDDKDVVWPDTPSENPKTNTEEDRKTNEPVTTADNIKENTENESVDGTVSLMEYGDKGKMEVINKQKIIDNSDKEKDKISNKKDEMVDKDEEIVNNKSIEKHKCIKMESIDTQDNQVLAIESIPENIQEKDELEDKSEEVVDKESFEKNNDQENKCMKMESIDTHDNQVRTMQSIPDNIREVCMEMDNTL